jgi:hypothetical protein
MRLTPVLIPVFLLASLGQAAILPDTIAAWQRGTPGAAPVPEPKVWAEYGLQDAETTPYTDGAKKISITAWRFNDSTGAMAAFWEIRPANAHASELMGLSAETQDKQIVAAGNYLFQFTGSRIKPIELSHIVATVPKYEHSPLPTLPKYMPEGMIPGTERYILGPAALAEFLPALPPSTAGFHFSAEGELAKYGKPGKQTTIVIFSYPTMEMARNRATAFQEIPGAVVKRTGPLVAAALGAPTPDVAENLLSQIKHQATVTIHERPAPPDVNFGKLLLNVVLFVLVVMAFMAVSGLVVGGLMILMRRGNASGDGDDMISLHIAGKQ